MTVSEPTFAFENARASAPTPAYIGRGILAWLACMGQILRLLVGHDCGSDFGSDLGADRHLPWFGGRLNAHSSRSHDTDFSRIFNLYFGHNTRAQNKNTAKILYSRTIRRSAARMAKTMIRKNRSLPMPKPVSLLPRGLSANQYLERLCRISIHGRVRLYAMDYRGSVLARRALLICYDHGWWRTPIGPFGRMSSGIWHAHLWPGWRLAPNPNSAQIPLITMGEERRRVGGAKL